MAQLELTLVDEWIHCPAVSSVREFLDRTRAAARLIVSPSGYTQRRQSEYPLIRAAGGRHIPDWWRADNPLFHGGFEIYRLAEAYYFPEFGVLVTPDGRVMVRSFGEAKYLLKDIANLPLTEVSGGRPIMTLPDEMAVFQQKAVTFPWGALTNYGHFVVDCLSGIAGIQAFGALGGYQFLFPELKPWHLRHLDLMNVAPIQQLPQTVVRLTDVIFTSAMDHFLHYSTEIIRTVADIERSALRQQAPHPAPGSRIYLSRRKISGRSFAGEAEVEQAMAGLGFQIVAPETLTVDEQIALFARAEAVVGFTGAAFANVIHCSPGAKIVEIQTKQMQGLWVRNLALFAECSYHPFFCGDLTATPPEWDTDEFCAYVRAVLG